MSRVKAPHINKIVTPTIFKPLECSKKVGLEAIYENKRLREEVQEIEDFAEKSAESVKMRIEKLVRSKHMHTTEMRQLIKDRMADEKNEAERKKKEKERKKNAEEQRKRKLDEETKEADDDDEDDVEASIKKKYDKMSVDAIWQQINSPEGIKEREEKRSDREEKDRIKSEIRRRNGESSEDEDDDDSGSSSGSHSGSRKPSKESRAPSVTQLQHWVNEASRKGDFIIDDDASGIKIKEVSFDEITGKIKITLVK